VSNGQFGCDLAAIGIACDDFTGGISTLTGANTSSLRRTDIVTGLPRSVGNHMNNGIDFGPDGALYVAQGANNGYGAPDPIWGNRSEDPLSAAVLRIDVDGITNAPYSVNTAAGYDPRAPGAKVTVYASGTRNPFSLLWHSNGQLYAPVNESANGDSPADPAGRWPALTNLPAFNDYFTRIVSGRYYGHPNPARGEYGLNGGNPTAGQDPFEVPQYRVGTPPNPKWRAPDLDLGLHRSADGSAEFRSGVFGSNLQGRILVTEYSQGKDIIAVKLDAQGKPVSTSVVISGLYNPLPIVVDNATGRVYVGEYGRDPDGDGGRLTLLSPR
jgi:glucose/arabinose dehydrogenase